MEEGMREANFEYLYAMLLCVCDKLQITTEQIDMALHVLRESNERECSSEL